MARPRKLRLDKANISLAIDNYKDTLDNIIHGIYFHKNEKAALYVLIDKLQYLKELINESIITDETNSKRESKVPRQAA